ncbi:MAG: hypothetical protein A2Y40_08800 [Candidatus Margulisbacteria bacterium GWF2_35_9]|nr:MAG: hypothetical protein A2Y40_08800 [Candidatus Margulisbacteria bacterium GWF2_35_9]
MSFYLVQDTIKNLSVNQSIELLSGHNNYLANLDPNSDKTVLDNYAKKHAVRITYIFKNGKIAFDSDNNASEMENHLNRPEIKEALHNKTGQGVRYSNTMKKQMLYIAWALPDYVLRTSIALKNIDDPIRSSVRKLLFFHIILLTIAIILIYKTTQTITRPLNKLTESIIKFGKGEKIEKLKVIANDEVGMLTDSFNKMSIQLTEDLKELKRLENIRKEFIANASHELKTPLTTINGFLETLENGAIDDPENNRRFIQIIKKNSNRLKTLVEDMLNLSAIENNKVEKKEVTISLVMNTLIEDMNLTDMVNIRIINNNKSLKVMAKEDDIYLAMQNYIDNAIKYCPNSEIEIIIKKLNNYLYFAVKDSGPGIEEKYQDRLFERFYRPDKTRSQDKGGTGLGLSIVKNVIKKYGGSVGLESEKDKGSIFYFTLPLVKS